MTLGWYDAEWWVGDDSSLGCSQKEREEVLDNTLIAWQFNFITNYTSVADSGIVSELDCFITQYSSGWSVVGVNHKGDNVFL